MNDSTQGNLSREEWKALKNLADDRSIVIKDDKVSSVVVWDRDDYLQEASGKLRDTNICEDVNINENILTGLVVRSNKIFNRLCSRKLISEKELKCFTYSFKKATNLGKLYFLPKIQERMNCVPVRPVISNWPYIKDSGDSLKKVKHLGQIPNGTLLVTVDVVYLYPSMPHKAGLETLRRRLNELETRYLLRI